MRLEDPAILKGFLRKHGLKDPTKELGQHFLVSTPAVNAIINAAVGCRGILEIGPGPGVLTGPLGEIAERLVALEIDKRMVTLLAESAPQAEVRSDDALRVDLAALLGELPEPRAIVSNLPYYITGALLQRVADVSTLLDRAILMMQREVALKIVAPVGDGERGSLSVYLQSIFTIRQLANVSAANFLPPPKVDSMVLLFTPRGVAYSEAYFKTIRQGFTQPRKTLANNLSANLHRSRDEMVAILEGMDLREKTRAQELNLEQWEELAKRLS